MEPLILVVDDDQKDLNANVGLLELLPEGELARHNINRLTIKTANNVSTALAVLRDAISKNHPFDVVLLDLNLPDDADDQFSSKENGLKLLREMRRGALAKAVIIVSHFFEYNDVASAFVAGAVNFVRKQYRDQDLQPEFLSSWSHVVTQQSQLILTNRITDLIPYAQRGLTHRFSSCFTGVMQSLLHEMKALESDLVLRLGLTRESDSQDSLLRHFVNAERVVREARREWKDISVTFSGRNEANVEVPLRSTLRKVRNDLLPVLTVKFTEVMILVGGETVIRSFQDDVELILREIITGAMSDLRDPPSKQTTIKIDVRLQPEHAEIQFSDDLPAIPSRSAEAVNRGQPVIPDSNFGRIWGLSIAQNIALLGGGRLVCTPAPGEFGNTITYMAPLANHA